jgi:predicted GNAT superfamily acetyltransferase
VLAEVNERPPNPGSMAFHAAIGFRVIGRADHGPDDKAVAFVEYAGKAPVVPGV